MKTGLLLACALAGSAAAKPCPPMATYPHPLTQA